MEPSENRFVLKMRVYVEDTDLGGVVYHARYLHFFERARTEWLRDCGIGQKRMREEEGLIFVVTDMNVRFIKPAMMDDELLVSASLSSVGRARFRFEQGIVRKSDGVQIATADVGAAILHSKNYKPARIPAWMKTELERVD
ncbi:MAG TPA: tol-pal system-associated acyl-CoA thioesterase [Xanthomonadales bacterium]|nr:tol-pal system-associated acyl-CoA thioesterase [Xanthomonadales bacterium]